MESVFSRISNWAAEIGGGASETRHKLKSEVFLKNKTKKTQSCHSSYHVRDDVQRQLSMTVTAVSPGTGSPGTWRHRWATCLRSWWTCPGWLASQLASSPCWTGPACWPHPASSCVSPAAEQRHKVALVQQEAETHAKEKWEKDTVMDSAAVIAVNYQIFRGLWRKRNPRWRIVPPWVSQQRGHCSDVSESADTLIRGQEDLLPGNTGWVTI